ncbi:GNAT family N-acetyltransferase [Halomarina oriensis]|uniref:N-acetyltransferase domain-containing protein n=1 Tax=Halomarina oriensis TaxID=671145 RepID=A0A6B0GKU2_9EURY|nr:hypothetical protein [Halomarina oriensis]
MGYAYGYTSSPGQYYHEALRSVVPPAVYARWFDDCFEFVELGVVERARGRGVGGRLHDALLAGRTHATSVLTTGVDNATARAFYEDRGWEALYQPFDPEGGEPMVVYGRGLGAEHGGDGGAAGTLGGRDDRSPRHETD